MHWRILQALADAGHVLMQKEGASCCEHAHPVDRSRRGPGRVDFFQLARSVRVPFTADTCMRQVLVWHAVAASPSTTSACSSKEHSQYCVPHYQELLPSSTHA